MNTVIGIKDGMTTLFIDGKAVAVTIIAVPKVVVAKVEKNGVEIGVGEMAGNNALRGKYKQLGYVPAYRKFVSGDFEDLKVGDVIKFQDVVSDLDVVSVTGVTKGKGFAGVVKRWGFAGGPRTHGQSDRERAPGSIGSGTTPGRVFKGKKMAGRLGGSRKTINSRVVKVGDGYVALKGAVPGAKGSYVIISVKK